MQENLINQSLEAKPNKFNLEIALILLVFGTNLPTTLLQNQILKQTCIKYGFNESDCSAMIDNGNGTNEMEDEIQPHVAEINMIIGLYRTIVPAVLSLCLGAWSDIYGRRKILNFSFFGYVLSSLSFTSVCYYSDYVESLDPMIYAACYVPEIIFGGWPTLITAISCHITDTCEEKSRAYRLTIVEFVTSFGVLVASLTCNLLMTFCNPLITFVISAVCIIISALIVAISVDEVGFANSISFCEFFTPILSIDVLQTIFNLRTRNERKILLSLITILMLNSFNYNATIAYLFERRQFEWTLVDHNYYQSVKIIFTMIGSIMGLLLLKKVLNLSNTVIIFLSLTNGLVDSLLKAFANQTWEMYAISSLTILKVLSSPMCRSKISIFLSHNEIGRVFSAAIFLEAISNFLASPVYTMCYNNSFKIFPAAFYFISVTAHAISLIFCISIMIMEINVNFLYERL